MPTDLPVDSRSRGLSTGEEHAVFSVDIYHFVDTDADGIYRGVTVEPAQGAYISGTPDRISTTLTSYPGKDSRLVFVVNARKSGHYGYAKDITLENFLDALIYESSADIPTSGLPMYGITGGVEIKKEIPGNILSDNGSPYPLLRVHAKFNISLREPLTEGVFELKTACLFNVKTRGYIAFDEGLLDMSNAEEPFVTAPHIPSATGNRYEPLQPYAGAGTDALAEDYQKIINKLYTLEADNANESDRLKKTALVVGGIYGDDTKVTYYRIDIDVTGGNILRNHLYDVEIQSVAGSGADSAKEAFEGVSSLPAIITPWELCGHEVVIDRQFHLEVDTDIYNSTASGGPIKVRASTDYTISDRGYPAGLYILASDVIYETGTGWIIIRDVVGTNGSLYREFELLTMPNYTGTTRSAQVLVKAGNLTKVIHVMQE